MCLTSKFPGRNRSACRLGADCRHQCDKSARVCRHDADRSEDKRSRSTSSARPRAISSHSGVERFRPFMCREMACLAMTRWPSQRIGRIKTRRGIRKQRTCSTTKLRCGLRLRALAEENWQTAVSKSLRHVAVRHAEHGARVKQMRQEPPQAAEVLQQNERAEVHASHRARMQAGAEDQQGLVAPMTQGKRQGPAGKR